MCALTGPIGLTWCYHDRRVALTWQPPQVGERRRSGAMVVGIRGYGEERACAPKKGEVAGNLVRTKVATRCEGFTGDEEEGGGAHGSMAAKSFRWCFSVTIACA